MATEVVFKLSFGHAENVVFEISKFCTAQITKESFAQKLGDNRWELGKGFFCHVMMSLKQIIPMNADEDLHQIHQAFCLKRSDANDVPGTQNPSGSSAVEDAGQSSGKTRNVEQSGMNSTTSCKNWVRL